MSDDMHENAAAVPAASGERYIPMLMDPEVDIEHWHRYQIASALVGGKRVLDIASGEGYGSALLASRAATVVGVDISADAVADAAQNYRRDNLSFRTGSCSAIPLADASVDVVVSFETLEHHGEHEEMFREIKRVLIPGGVCIISTPDRYIYSEITDYKNPFHVKELSAGEFDAIVKKYFLNHSLLGQKYLIGSFVRHALPSGAPADYYLQTKLGTAPEPEPFAPKYLIAVASDGELPDLRDSVLESGYFFAAQQAELDRLNGLLSQIAGDLAQSRENEGRIVAAIQGAQQERDAFAGAASDRERERDEALARIARLEAASLAPGATELPARGPGYDSGQADISDHDRGRELERERDNAWARVKKLEEEALADRARFEKAQQERDAWYAHAFQLQKQLDDVSAKSISDLALAESRVESLESDAREWKRRYFSLYNHVMGRIRSVSPRSVRGAICRYVIGLENLP